MEDPTNSLLVTHEHSLSLLLHVLSVGLDELVKINLHIVQPITPTWYVGWWRDRCVDCHRVASLKETFDVVVGEWHCGVRNVDVRNLLSPLQYESLRPPILERNVIGEVEVLVG